MLIIFPGLVMTSKFSLHHHSLFTKYTLILIIMIMIISSLDFLSAHDDHHSHVEANHDDHDHHKPTSSSPFGFLKHLEGFKRGDKVQGIRDLKKYLQHFGYLNPTQITKTQITGHSLNDNSINNDISTANDSTFDDLLEAAIKTYQTNYNLKPTGTLDSQTLSKMMMPRCAVADIINNDTGMRSSKKSTTSSTKNHIHRKLLGQKYVSIDDLQTVSHYSFFSGKPKWPSSKYSLTYGLAEGMTSEDAEAVGRAFQTWVSNTHFSFSRAQGNTKADIRVSFERRDHGDGDPFDGAGGVLGHAFSPTDGRLHFDADETWAIGEVADAFDVETVALHEIGHILGLMHSSVEGAIMYPQIGSGLTKGLHADDIQGINALYNVVV